MWLANLWRRNPKLTPAQPKRAQLAVERLEDREVPAVYTAATVPELIASISAANQSAEADTITLVPGKTFTLTTRHNEDYGPTGLPTIAASGGSLTIVGNGDVIERSRVRQTPAFRLFSVAPGGSLTLENLTVQGGHAVLWGNWTTVGGGIANFGALTLHGVTVQNNVAGINVAGSDEALGGGIYSGGTLTVTGSTIRNNQVFGRTAVGGGLCVWGTATILSTTVTSNEAKGSPKSKEFAAGQGIGGGLCIGAGAVVYLDAFTVDHITSNKASTSDPNIYGEYIVLT